MCSLSKSKISLFVIGYTLQSYLACLDSIAQLNHTNYVIADMQFFTQVFLECTVLPYLDAVMLVFKDSVDAS